MPIEKISYHKTFNLGNYSNEKIGIDIVLGPGDDPLQAFADAKKQVERSHQFFAEAPDYERAKKVVENPDDFTGRDVKRAKETIEAFESIYPDFIAKFQPASRQLKESPVRDAEFEDDDYDSDVISPEEDKKLNTIPEPTDMLPF